MKRIINLLQSERRPVGERGFIKLAIAVVLFLFALEILKG